MIGNILVNRDVEKIPINRKDSKINGQSFSLKNQRKRNIAIGSGNINVTGLGDAYVAGNTLFLGVSVRVFLKEIHT